MSKSILKRKQESTDTTPQKAVITESLISTPDLSQAVTPSTTSSSSSDENVLTHQLKEQLESKIKTIGALPQTAHGEPILLDNCSVGLFNQIRDWLRGKGISIVCAYIDEAVIIVETHLSKPHEAASRFISDSRCSYNNGQGYRDIFSPLESLGSADIRLTQGGIVQPDDQYYVLGRHCPNVVVEVGISQSLESLHARAVGYLTHTDNILVVVTVKVYPDRRMIALLYLRELQSVVLPISVISFGLIPLTTRDIEAVHAATGDTPVRIGGYCDWNNEPACTMAGMPAYMLTIPRQHLLSQDNNGNVNPRWIHYGDWVIDLYNLKVRIENALQREIEEANL